MSWIDRLVSSLRTRRMEEDLEKELEFHLEMRAREKTRTGVAAEEAHRQALHRFGSLTRTKEACRDESTFAWLAALRQDLRYAARNIRKNPGFAAAAVACLAMGIGANAAVFSFVNAFLFQPLPPRVVLVQRASGSPISYPELRDWQRLNRVFDEVFAYTPGERFTIGLGADGEHVLGETVTGNYFRTLGVDPAVGRLFANDDDLRPLAVIGYRFWRDHYLGDPAIAGKIIWINREAFTIAGVAPPAFQGMLAPWSTDVWVTPSLHRDALADRRTGWMMAASRLKTGITARQATAAITALDDELARQYPDPQRRRDPLTLLRRSGLSGSPVWGVFLVMSALLMTVAGLIFLIACANVAGLLFARAAVRRREILIRLSVGASRSMLIRQLLTESLVLGLLGAAAGVVMAFAAGDALAGLMPSSISGGFHFQHGIDTHVLAYTLTLSTASVLLSGLLPAFRASDQNLAGAGRTLTAVGGRTPKLRQWLIVVQVASSVLVLATAGVFVRTFQKAQSADTGFDTKHLLTADLDLRAAKYLPAQIAGFYGQVRSRLGDLPGVVSVSFADILPLGNTRVVTVPAQGEVATATVDSNYLRTIGIQLLRGREPQPEEQNVAIVNAAFARRLWPGQDPIGKSIRLGADPAPRQVIGLTATGKYWSLTEPERPFVYQISNRFGAPSMSLAIRTQGPPGNLVAGITEAIHRLDPQLPAMRVQTEGERLRISLEPERAAAVLLSILGLAALGLAITGLYALLAQFVAQRSPEIAVRMALGASRAAVIAMLLRQSALLIFLGTSAGIAAATAIARLLASLSGQVNPLDGTTVIGVAALLAAVGAAATLVPAYRAVSIDPVNALRAE